MEFLSSRPSLGCCSKENVPVSVLCRATVLVDPLYWVGFDNPLYWVRFDDSLS